MGAKKRVNKYPRAFQLMALERMKKCESVSALAEELGIHRTVLYHWKNHLKAIEGGAADSPIRELRKQVRDLKRVLAEKTLEVDFFKGALQKIEARRQGRQQLWRDGIYDQIREVMPMQGGLSVERMCELARVSRAGFYRSLRRVLRERRT